MTKEAERAAKLERKLDIITHGYLNREKGLRASIQQASFTLQVCPSCSPRNRHLGCSFQ